MDGTLIQDFPIAYVERPLPVDEDGEAIVDEVLDPTAFNPGARLVLKDRAIASAPETIITEGVFPAVDADGTEPLYDVKDLSVSADGRRLLFAMRAPEIEDADDDEQPTWNIWEYDLDDGDLRRIVSSDTVAEQGQDVAPQYTDDGKIVFSSTRQRRTRALLLDEQKPQYAGLDDDGDNEALVLHVMDADGTDIEQISFNMSHDLDPTLLSTGELVYLRWDAISNRDVMSLYKMNPDGTEAQAYFGYHTQNTGTNGAEVVLTRTQQMEDGRLVALLRPRETARLGGNIVAIDPTQFFNASTPLPNGAGITGQEDLSALAVDTEELAPSTGGTYSSVYPLYDNTNRLLVSWSQCRLIDPITDEITPCTDFLLSQNAAEAPLLYGLWIFDPESQTQLPVKVPSEGTLYTDAVALAPRTPSEFYFPPTLDEDWVNEEVGVVHIRSVYDVDGIDVTDAGIVATRNPLLTPVDSLEARFIRIVKGVAIPDDEVLDFDNAAFGINRGQSMKDILGYVPIEPDGSAQFKIPADVSVMLDVVDAQGMRIHDRHYNWFSVRSGEVRECTSCHERNSGIPHGRMDAEPASANPGAVGGVAFANTQLRDAFGAPEVPPSTEETMAEYRARVLGPRTPSMDLIYSDEWTNPTAATPGGDISVRYIDILTQHTEPLADSEARKSKNPADFNCAPLANEPPLWQAPTNCLAAGSWTSKCRTTINYLTSIHPLWEADRRTCDAGGNITIDTTCTSCHSKGPADMIVVPAGQLDLTGETSIDRNDYITSYVELLAQDIAQTVEDNSLVNLVRLIPTGEFETDANGDLILDVDGNPIEIILREPVTLPVPMSTNGARDSSRFFSRFASGGTHEGYLTEHELKLIAEWLDLGGQYYNNPFDAPVN